MMKKGSFQSDIYPDKDESTNYQYSVDVLVLYNDKCYIGYYHFSSGEWRYSDPKNNEEKTFEINYPYDLEWQKIENQ